MIQALLVLALLAGVIWFMVGGFRSVGSGAASPGDAAPLRGAAAFLTGIVAVTALASILARGVDASSAMSTTSMAFGVAAVLTTLPGMRLVINWLFGAIGAIAAIPAIASLLSGTADCVPPSTNPLLQAGLGILLTLMFGISFLLSLGVRTGNPGEWASTIAPLSGLGLFGALELIAFLQTPLGVALLPQHGLAQWLTAIGVTVVIGLLAARRPELVLGAAAVSVFASTLGVEAADVACGDEQLAAVAFPGLVGYTVAFGVVWLILRLVTRRGR